jgi:hypothetical protein
MKKANEIYRKYVSSQSRHTTSVITKLAHYIGASVLYMYTRKDYNLRYCLTALISSPNYCVQDRYTKMY